MRDPATLKKYLYAAADPNNKIDPTGRQALVERQLLTGFLALNLATLGYWENQTQAGANLLAAVGSRVCAIWYTIEKKMKCIAEFLKDLKACEEAYQTTLRQSSSVLKRRRRSIVVV